MNPKTIYILILIVLITFLFFGLGDDFLYAKTGIKRWTPFLIIFLLIPFILSRLLKLFNIHGKANQAYCFASFLLIGPLFGFWVENLSETDLNKNGINTIGVVSDKWKSGRGQWSLKCKFVANKKVYKTFTKRDKENLYKIGDSLTILYSSNYPDNNKIIELE